MLLFRRLCDQKTRVSRSGKVELGNLLSHLNTKHKYLLLEEDRNAALVKASGRQDSGASNVVVSVETHKERMVAFLLTGGLPFQLCENPAFLLFCSQYGIPEFSRRTLGRKRDDMQTKFAIFS